MNKAALERRKIRMAKKMQDPNYANFTSYEKQMKIKKETYIDDRIRVA